MKTSFELKTTFKVNPNVLFEAWLNSDEHSNMTGGKAQCSDEIGGEFSAWDGYISGMNKTLIQDEEIVQRWRTSEFAKSDSDSVVTLKFKKTASGCELTLTHNNIPEGQSDYKQGWIDNYFNPMKAYFN